MYLQPRQCNVMLQHGTLEDVEHCGDEPEQADTPATFCEVTAFL